MTGIGVAQRPSDGVDGGHERGQERAVEITDLTCEVSDRVAWGHLGTQGRSQYLFALQGHHSGSATMAGDVEHYDAQAGRGDQRDVIAVTRDEPFGGEQRCGSSPAGWKQPDIAGELVTYPEREHGVLFDRLPCAYGCIELSPDRSSHLVDARAELDDIGRTASRHVRGQVTRANPSQRTGHRLEGMHDPPVEQHTGEDSHDDPDSWCGQDEPRHQSGGAFATVVGRFGASFEHLLETRQRDTQLVEELLAARTDRLINRCRWIVLASRDRWKRDVAKPSTSTGRHGGDVLSHRRVAARQNCELALQPASLGPPVVKGLEKRRVARDHEPALAGLHVEVCGS